jgi:hypothetical protein
MSVSKLLLAKPEVTEGVDPTPDDTNAIETMNLEMMRYEGDRVAREVDRQTLGGVEQINTVPHTNTSFDVPLAGSGTAGDAPLWGVLMTACGFDETLVAVTSAAYQLVETAAELAASDTVALYDYRSQAGTLQKTLGCRGACSISMGEGELPKISFSDLIGSYLQPAAGTEATGIDWSGWLTELPFTVDNVPTITLDSISACTSAFSIDFGQAVARRNLPNCESTVISDYDVTGEMTIVAPDVSVTNWWAKAESHQGVTLYPLAIILGTVAGNIIQIDAAEVQVVSMTEGETNQGDLSYTFTLAFIDRPVITAL